MYLLSTTGPAKAIESFMLGFVRTAFEFFVLIPFLFILLIYTAGRLFGAVRALRLVKKHTVNDSDYEFSKAEPLRFKKGIYSEFQYSDGYYDYILDAKIPDTYEMPVYVLYNIKRPGKGVVYIVKYQHDEVIRYAMEMLLPAVLLIIEFVRYSF